MTEYFYDATELAKTRRNNVTTEQFYVTIELARLGGISIATKLSMIESFATHERAGRTKAGTHDSVALCCVAIEEAMHARQTRPGAYDRPWARTIEVHA